MITPNLLNSANVQLLLVASCMLPSVTTDRFGAIKSQGAIPAISLLKPNRFRD